MHACHFHSTSFIVQVKSPPTAGSAGVAAGAFWLKACASLRHKCCTSRCPVTKTRMPPCGSCRWICATCGQADSLRNAGCGDTDPECQAELLRPASACGTDAPRHEDQDAPMRQLPVDLRYLRARLTVSDGRMAGREVWFTFMKLASTSRQPVTWGLHLVLLQDRGQTAESDS